MPLFFYLPMIIWLGIVDTAQKDMRAPLKIKSRK